MDEDDFQAEHDNVAGPKAGLLAKDKAVRQTGLSLRAFHMWVRAGYAKPVVVGGADFFTTEDIAKIKEILTRFVPFFVARDEYGVVERQINKAVESGELKDLRVGRCRYIELSGLMKLAETNNCFTLAEVAKRLGLSVDRAAYRAKKGQLGSVRMPSGHRRFSEEHVRAYLAKYGHRKLRAPRKR